MGREAGGREGKWGGRRAGVKVSGEGGRRVCVGERESVGE